MSDKASGSANEPEGKTVFPASSRVTDALNTGGTAAAADLLSSQLIPSEGPGTTDTADAPPVTVLPPEPAHHILATPDLAVRNLTNKNNDFTEITIG